MADQDDVRRIALSLPETVESQDTFGFRVRNAAAKSGSKQFAWTWHERVTPGQPRVPRPDVLAVRVAGQAEKDMLLAADPDKFFTEPHYDGFPAVLVRLAALGADELRELITDAWRCQAPRVLVRESGLLLTAHRGHPGMRRSSPGREFILLAPRHVTPGPISS